jgi:hypothetical protein
VEAKAARRIPLSLTLFCPSLFALLVAAEVRPHRVMLHNTQTSMLLFPIIDVQTSRHVVGVGVRYDMRHKAFRTAFTTHDGIPEEYPHALHRLYIAVALSVSAWQCGQ